MKMLGIFAILSLFLLAQGCRTNDKDTAGREGNVTAPEPATNLAVTANVPQVMTRLTPAANGGSSLPALAPYNNPGGTAVQQNINPAPFLVAAGSQSGGPSSGAALITSGGLASRADGTMSGPNDQPAASTGWGTQGPQTNPAATSAKPATHPTKAPPK